MLEQMWHCRQSGLGSWRYSPAGKRTRYWKRSPIIWKRRPTDILRANAEDLAEARANGLSEAMLDRLAR